MQQTYRLELTETEIVILTMLLSKRISENEAFHENIIFNKLVSLQESIDRINNLKK